MVEMVHAKINGKNIVVPKGTSIMQACEQMGVQIPKLCFLKDINEIGACRMCVVEIEGKQNLVASCNNVVEEGMSILTDSLKVHMVRETNVEFILSQHDYRCATCVRNGNCTLQSLAQSLNIIDVPYKTEIERESWNMEFPLIRDAGKCIKCMRCVQVCDKVQHLGIWDILNTGKRTIVNTKEKKPIEKMDCVLCGQCITHCPTGALRERDDTRIVREAIMDENKIVIVQVAPAVRTSWGESLGLKEEEATIGKMVAAIRAIGFDYVFDTDFSADLTIMEEASELLDRLKNHKEKLPMFTSCCPGWVRLVKNRYPEYLENLSSAKSPQQMFGSIAKSYFAEMLGVEPERIFCVSVMPCVAKKYECAVPQVNVSDGIQDVEVVLTTRELERMIRMARVNMSLLEEDSFDLPFGLGSGAGVLFGTTGGVMEAALRSASYFVKGVNPKPEDFKAVRGQKGIREVTTKIGDVTIHAAVVTGIGNAQKLMNQIQKKEVSYDFVEVMACPGGCVGGGGQPIHDGEEWAQDRSLKLYGLDRVNIFRFSHENPAIKDLYEKYLGEPLSKRSHQLLHTSQKDWD